MSKLKDIKFICNKCGAEQEPAENGNWNVYRKEKCKCGGDFKLKEIWE